MVKITQTRSMGSKERFLCGRMIIPFKETDLRYSIINVIGFMQYYKLTGCGLMVLVGMGEDRLRQHSCDRGDSVTSH